MTQNTNTTLIKQTAIVIYSNIVVYFDFLIYLYLADTLSATFFPSTDNLLLSKVQECGIFTIGYLARPFGGLLIGRFGDTKGRKPAFVVTTVFIIITSLVTACLPTYAQIGIIAPILFVLLRIAQGMCFGAHSVLGWVFISEHAPKQKLGMYVSIVSISFLIGLLVATLVFKVVFATFSLSMLADYVWRLIFIGSAVCGSVALFLYRYLEETPFFLNVQTTTYIPKGRDINLRYGRFHAIFLSLLLSFQLASLAALISILLPKLILLKFAIDESMLNLANFIGIVFFILGILFYGMLADRGRMGRALMLGSTFTIVQALIFYYTLEHTGTEYIVIIYAMLGFSAGIIALAPIIMLQLFPTKGRLTAVAVIYNITYGIVGGLLPLVLLYTTATVALSPALYIVFVSLIGLITGQYLYQAPEYSYLDTNKLSYLKTDNRYKEG